MIISKDSFFRYPPTSLHPKQVIIFNAITYSVDICEITYKRLMKELVGFSDDPKSDNENYPSIFADVWTIISNSTIFFNLVNSHFSLETDLNIFSELKKCKQLRNSYQHIDERISEVITLNELPLYGSLSWTRNILGTQKFQKFALYSGAFTNNNNGISLKVSNSEVEFGCSEIADINFESIIKINKNEYPTVEISIKKIMSDLTILIENFENEIETQLKNFDVSNRHKTNPFVQMNGSYIDNKVIID